MKTLLMFFIGTVITLSADMSRGHHNFRSVFDSNRQVEVTGVVTEVRWVNPHARFFVEAEDENGEKVVWDFELASPNSLMRRGWRHDSLKPGDTVTVTAFPARSVPNLANTSAVTLSDGQSVYGMLTSPPE